MKNNNFLYKIICIWLCFVLVMTLVAFSLTAKANSEKGIGEVLASTNDEADEILYSFGLLSDIHIQYDTATDDFRRALTYLKDKVPFTCVCGDLVSYATAENMAEYKEYVEAYADRMPLFECAGNHDTYDFVDGEVKAKTLTDEMLTRWINATGKENPNYSFEYGDDVFIFLSIKSDNPDDMFVDGGLQWLEKTLKDNRNKRCFVFQHIHDPEDSTADPSHAYSDVLNGISGREFLRLIKNYENTVWFHGHTHLTFQGEYSPINEELGYRSVHIPSLASPRFYDEKLNVLENFYFDENNRKIWGALHSEGYIVDIYADKIVLKGINFASGDSRSKVELLDNKVFTLDTTFSYTEPEEVTTSAPEYEIETTLVHIQTTADVWSDPSESGTETSLLTNVESDSEETEPDNTSGFEIATQAPIGLLGDANSDGRVNIKDSTFIRKVIAKIFELSETASICADVNSDNKVSIKDATLIQKYSANLETGIPLGMPVAFDLN